MMPIIRELAEPRGDGDSFVGDAAEPMPVFQCAVIPRPFFIGREEVCAIGVHKNVGEPWAAVFW